MCWIDFRSIDFSKTEVIDLHGINGRPKYVYMAFVVNVAALKEFPSQQLKTFQGDNI